MSVLTLVVGLAAILQYATAVLALRVLRITGKAPAWVLIAAVAFLMAIRRTIILYRSLSYDTVLPVDLAGECVGLAISVLMVVGVARIGPFFLSIQRSREQLRRRTRDLGKRVKELNCLYGISHLVEQADNSLEDIIRGVVELTPPSWQYPEATCVRIILDGQVRQTRNFKETVWKQTADVVVQGEYIGCI